MKKMKTTIASYSFHGLFEEGKTDLFGYLESCKYRYHLDTADIWNGMLVSTDDDYLAKVKEALEERQLSLVNLCVDEANIWDDDTTVRERLYQNALAHLHAAEVLGAKTVRIDAGGRGETFTAEQFDWIVKRYSEYAQRAYDNGYKVGPENHWGPDVLPENMVRICEAVNHPAFGVLLHFKSETDSLMAPWAMHTHISWKVAEESLKASIHMLNDCGYAGYWGVEHHSGQDEYNRVAIQLARVREGLARISIN